MKAFENVSLPQRIVRSLLPSGIYQLLIAIPRQIRNSLILAFEYGQLRSSCRGMSVDAHGDPIPWYSYPAVEFLMGLDLKSLSVFEFGGGMSTLWWLKRARRVVMAETEPAWRARVKAMAGPNLTVSEATEASLAAQLASFQESFDIIIVDGPDRPACLDAALAHIKQWGGKLLILDNSDRFPDLLPLIRNTTGWVQSDFHGFSANNSYTTSTTIFINPAHDLHSPGKIDSISGLSRHGLVR